jgi:peptidyl-tRNA hydrolase, PTH1 family
MPSLRWLTRHGALEQAQQIRLVVGLGNPGVRYANSRHNAGFMVVERFASEHGFAFSRKRFNAQFVEGNLEGKRVMLAKPQTFMNSSGEAVGKLYSFYKIAPEDLLVVYDDLDLPLGKIRMRSLGSSGGHHGMESIIGHIGTSAFPRLRIGIGRPNPEADIDHVLGSFDASEQKAMNETCDRAAKAIDAWLAEGISVAMNQFN